MRADGSTRADGQRSPGWFARPLGKIAFAALVLWGLSALLSGLVTAAAGLHEALFQGVGPGRVELLDQTTRAIDLEILGQRTAIPDAFTIRWSGAWFIARSRLYRLDLDTDDRAVWRIDGHIAHDRFTGDGRPSSRTVWLSRGFHAIDIEYEHHDGAAILSVLAAPVDQASRALDPNALLTAVPAHGRLRGWLYTVLGALRVAALVVLTGAGIFVIRRVGRRASVRFTSIAWSGAALRVGRAVRFVLPVLVVGYAAALRLDALTVEYGPIDHPGWLQVVQQHIGAPLQGLKPSGLTWDAVPLYPHRGAPESRYASDPFTYLEFAREMHSFYRAHYREPLFPFVTKVFLGVLDDQDVAVSFASLTFSVLAVLSTYVLGAFVFSRWVGLGAALAMAIDADLISWGIGGWRDDAFTVAVVMFAYAVLRHLRAPSTWTAIAVGLVGAAGCLLRITAVSFVAPGLACLLFLPGRAWKTRLRAVGLAVLTMTLLVGPYLFNCWRVFGDPLYAINYHTHNYLFAEGNRQAAQPSAAAYVGDKVVDRPFQTIDTIALGLTSYPFLNKWQGLDPWTPLIGTWLSRAALVGLLLFAGSPSGRVLLLVLGTSLLPFSVTWKVADDWRFTEHAYPFLLLASAYGMAQMTRWVIGGGRWFRDRLTSSVRVWAAVVAGVGLVIWTVVVYLPVATIREAVAANDAGVVQAGDRDTAFFTEGWSAPWTQGNVTFRVTVGSHPVVRVPLPRVDDYDLTIRLDPFPRPLGALSPGLAPVWLVVNGRVLSRLELNWNPERVGSYQVHLPSSAVIAGMNRLEFVLDPDALSRLGGGLPPAPGLSEGAAVGVWVVRVQDRQAKRAAEKIGQVNERRY